MPMISSLNWQTGSARLDPNVWNNITYAFVPQFSFAPTPNAPGGRMSEGWNAVERAAFTKALKVFETFLPLTFNNVADANYVGAVFVAVAYTHPQGNVDDLGAFMPPGEPNAGRGEFNKIGTGWHEAGGGGLNPGGQGFETLIHELGHGLGLKHPHDDGGGGEPIYDGVTSAFGDYGLFSQNMGIYTMMSYNQGWANGPAGSRPDAAGLYGRVATPMAFDIAVLQAKYGARAFATGNNIYTVDDANGVGTYWACIWDTGGNDTIRYNGTKASVINLNMASLAHNWDGGGKLSYAKYVAGGFTIANGVWIENATGGNGADSLTGNGKANALSGRGGNDTLIAGNGNDALFGGDGNDSLNGGGNTDRITGDAGRDTMTGGADARDIFDFNSYAHTGKTATTRDRISDFQPGIDDIDLSTIDANGAFAGSGAFKFLTKVGAGFTGIAGQLRWFVINPAGTANDRTIIEGDINANKVADFQIELIGLRNLKIGDFVL